MTGGKNKKICIVTGGNAGLGFETAKQLVASGRFHVIIGCRDMKKAETACQDIVAATHENSIEALQVDLTSLRSVMQFVERFRARRWPLHALVLNAGVLPLGVRDPDTEDGFERVFAANYLGHFLLTLALLDTLAAGAPSRVIAVSSLTHTYCKQFHFDDIHLSRSWSKAAAYAQSKAALVSFAFELNRRYATSLGVYANALEPGLVASDILRDAHWFIRRAGTGVLRLFGRSAAGGAYTSVYLASAPELDRIGGRFYAPSGRACAEAKYSSLCADRAVARRLWEISAAATELQRRLPPDHVCFTRAVLEPLPSAVSAVRGRTRWWLWFSLLLVVPCVFAAALLWRF